jgi:hypothetical protein
MTRSRRQDRSPAGRDLAEGLGGFGVDAELVSVEVCRFEDYATMVADPASRHRWSERDAAH